MYISYFSGSVTDYLDFTTNPLSIPFTENLRSQSFDVTIVDDSFYEPTEDFTVSLTQVSVVNFDSSRVRVDPDLATVTITDDDSKCNTNQYGMCMYNIMYITVGLKVARHTVNSHSMF